MVEGFSKNRRLRRFVTVPSEVAVLRLRGSRKDPISIRESRGEVGVRDSIVVEMSVSVF